MNGEYARFRVHGVSLERSTGRCRLLLTDQDEQISLSVEVEPHQAGEVILRANGFEPDAADVLEIFFRAHGFHLMYVRVPESKDSCRLAEVHYRERARCFQLDLPLSQAIALAGRMAAPVYLHERIIPDWLSRESSKQENSHRAEVLPLRTTISASG
jgi:uncharacterized protein